MVMVPPSPCCGVVSGSLGLVVVVVPLALASRSSSSSCSSTSTRGRGIVPLPPDRGGGGIPWGGGVAEGLAHIYFFLSS